MTAQEFGFMPVLTLAAVAAVLVAMLTCLLLSCCIGKKHENKSPTGEDDDPNKNNTTANGPSDTTNPEEGLSTLEMFELREKQREEERRKKATQPRVFKELPPANFTAVEDMGACSDQNSRFRKAMEDEHVLIDQFANSDDSLYVAVYDGHGGTQVAQFVKEHLHQNLEKKMSEGSLDPAAAIRETYLETDSQVCQEDIKKAGCTSASAFIKKNKLYTANVGDANIVLNRNGKAELLSYEHKSTDPNEIERLTKGPPEEQCMIINKKVCGMLAITRSFGDIGFKKWVFADPYQTETTLLKTDTSLILACDGVWDVMKPQDAVDLYEKHKEKRAAHIAQLLAEEALKLGTTDNLTVIIVKLKTENHSSESEGKASQSSSSPSPSASPSVSSSSSSQIE